MKELPITYSAVMLRALQEGRKSVTRRVIKPQPKNQLGYMYVGNGIAIQCGADYPDTKDDEVKCPYGQEGDVLWTKETWAICSFSEFFEASRQLQIAYKAGVTDISHPDGMSHDLEWFTVDHDTWKKYATEKYYRWQSPRFMPRKFARDFREITSVRAEKLQDITEIEAIKEGIPNGAYAVNPIASFKILWDSINAKRGYSYESNPWVWPIEYKKMEVKN